MTLKDLKKCRRWMPWKIHNNGKAPCNRSGFLCADNVEGHWMTHEEAQGVVATGKAQGVRLCFSPDSNGEMFGVVAWDLDGAVNASGDVAPWAAEIVQAINSYTEVSPSGDGLHIFALADDLPIGKRTEPVMGGGKVEFFHGSGGLTFTGNAQDGFTEIKVSTEECLRLHRQWFPEKKSGWQPTGGTSTLTDEEVVEKALKAKNCEEFEQLYECGVGYGDASVDDFYLLSMLYFWCGGDPEQMDRLFRESALFRDKWDEKHTRDGRTYGQLSIDNVLCLAEDGGWATYSGHADSDDGERGPQERQESDEFEEITPLVERTGATFPVDTLPQWAREFVEAVAVSYQVPPGFLAMIFLGLMAAIHMGRYAAHISGEWREELALWIIAAMETGSGRSSPMERIIEPLRREENHLQREWRQVKAEAEQRKKQAKQGKGKGPFDLFASLCESEGPPPPQPTLILENVTLEAVARKMVDNHNRATIVSDEGGPLAILQGRYQPAGQISPLEDLLKAYSGGTFTVTRVKDQFEIKVSRAQLTYILSPQTDLALELARNKNLRSRGLLARFLWAFPESLAGQLTPLKGLPTVPPRVSEEYERRVTTMMEPIQPDEWGVPVRTTLRFAPEAETAMIIYHNECKRRRLGDGADIWDWLSKAHGQCARIAALLHLADGHKGDVMVSGGTVRRALQIITYLEGQTWMAYFGKAPSSNDSAVIDAERILKWLKKEKNQVVTTFTANQAIKDLKTKRVKQAKDLKAGLDHLIRCGYLRVQGRVMMAAGRRTREYVINPAWDRS